ncbi:MAG: hypothetical protein R3346_04750, partial [Candidatus Spechtbacterales bacterium]|nr:hypothetical protein [Candidatus Spechtbacterales bacterium]
MIKTKKQFSIITTALLSLVFLLSAPGASAQSSTVSFNIDPDYDSVGRSQINASLRIDGTKADFYVEDAYWNNLPPAEKGTILSTLGDIEQTFSTSTYPRVTEVFGSEWSPGIDGEEKITILFTSLDSGIGGYFREEDEIRRSQIASSNEREMFYINTEFLSTPRHAEAFIAHELQHLINYNQRVRLRDIRDELWVNEMLSEIAPTIAGLNDVYPGSNLASRVRSFKDNTSNSLIGWNSKTEDYAAASIFGHYLLDQYGEEFFTKLMETNATGEDGINQTLKALGKTET